MVLTKKNHFVQGKPKLFARTRKLARKIAMFKKNNDHKLRPLNSPAQSLNLANSFDIYSPR